LIILVSDARNTLNSRHASSGPALRSLASLNRHSVPLGLVAGGQQLLTGQRPGNARRGRHAPDLRAGRRQRPGGEREQKQTCGTQRHGDSPILWCSQLAGEKRQKIGILPAARGLLLEAR
jgi:hypothetical protein